MARHESDREDLLAEARNLVERVSLQLPGETEELVAGFRRDGSLAIFFTPQRVYQFTSSGSLRRAFCDDVLYKAQHGKMFAMRRERAASAVHLVSRPLDATASSQFLSDMQSQVQRLQAALRDQMYRVIGQVPAGADVIRRLNDWLSEHADQVTIASSPRSA